MMDEDLLVADFRWLLQRVGVKGEINESAYDTAWVARLDASIVEESSGTSSSAFPAALEWLIHHQHPDGSWGEGGIPERLLATSAAVLALAEKGNRASDTAKMERGLRFLWRCLPSIQKESVLPIGFELLIGALAEEGLKYNLNFPVWLTTHYEEYRQQKLKLIQYLPPAQFRKTTAVFSLEFLGQNLPSEPESFVDKDGGVCCSPAATASVLRYVTDDTVRQKMLGYLKDNEQATSHGSGWGDHSRFDLFEIVWVLYNLHLCKHLNDPRLNELVNQLLIQLEGNWSEAGIGAGTDFLTDSDDTAMAYTVMRLAQYDQQRQCDLNVLDEYWRKEGYLVTYRYERDPSVSANIHALEAYYLDGQTDKMQQLLQFLKKQRPADQPFWLDKWHISPYYASSHAVMATVRFDPSIVTETINWMIFTQTESGGWGLEEPTSEETALAVQALIVYSEVCGWTDEARKAARAGVRYLRRNYRPYIMSYTPLWVGKNRYAPQLVIRSTILSALMMAQNHQL